eukprot:SAG31_NODE_8541_length_1433_cov_0.901049_1_plen_169_part_10
MGNSACLSNMGCEAAMDDTAPPMESRVVRRQIAAATKIQAMIRGFLARSRSDLVRRQRKISALRSPKPNKPVERRLFDETLPAIVHQATQASSSRPGISWHWSYARRRERQESTLTSYSERQNKLLTHNYRGVRDCLQLCHVDVFGVRCVDDPQRCLLRCTLTFSPLYS